MDPQSFLVRLIEEQKVYHCVECGKCTGACPLARVDGDFSPRLVAEHAIRDGIHSVYLREKAWACLTCGLCDERCPSGIRFTDFVRAIRPIYLGEGRKGHLSHGGALQGLMRMQAAPDLRQNRLDWITPDLKTSSQGEVLYFVGCLPYLEKFFGQAGAGLTKIAADTVRILNAAGITPVVLPDERCCGHDLVWTGDEKAFQDLRRLNVESFKRAGIKTIVTACGECSHVLKDLYPDSPEPFPFEVMHVTEVLRNCGLLGGRRSERIATYQDPCRLGRFQGVYEAPRELLSPLMELREMPHYGAGAWCCGNSAWLHCDRSSKQMQVERLLEAKGTGGDLIVTACPKCQVHLNCAMGDVNLVHDLRMEVRDVVSVLAESLSG